MKKNFLRICVAFLGVSLVACLDDSKYALDPSGTENVIEFIDPSVPTSAAGSVYPVWTSVTEVGAPVTITQTVSYSGPNSNKSDIELTLGVDPSALDEYNDQQHRTLHGPEYEMMPDNYYEFTNTSVTIPKGETKAEVSFKVFPDEFDLSRSFALPVRIISSSEGILSAHFSVAIVAVVVKNAYDGIYSIKAGNIQRNSGTGPDPALSGDYVKNLEIPFQTINGVLTAFQPVWKEGSGIAGIDATKVEVLGSAAGNGAPSGTFAIAITSSNPSMALIPGALNYYDPASRTFVMNFQWGAAPNTRVITGLTLQWNRARD